MRLADVDPKHLRTAYVTCMRAARGVARRLGLLALLERSRRPALRFVRSLFAIYDVGDLAAIDLPWWNFATIAEVEAFLAGRPNARVFEYGSGASTVWLARRAAAVRTVEHDPEFADAVRELLDGFDNVEVVTVPATPLEPGCDGVTSERAKGLDFSDYVAAIERLGWTFDLIVIDGRARVESFRRAAPYLADDGLLVFDDVERSRYRPALDTPEFQVEVLRGLTPCVPYPTSTALLTWRRH
jgi:hypothetical protein